MVELTLPGGYTKEQVESKSECSYDYKKNIDILCQCSAMYCLECKRLSHSPVPCNMFGDVSDTVLSRPGLGAGPLVPEGGMRVSDNISGNEISRLLEPIRA